MTLITLDGCDGEGGSPCPELFISCPDFWRLRPNACTCGPPSSQPLWKLTDFINLEKNFPARGGPRFILYSCERETEKAMFTYLPGPGTSLGGSRSHAQTNFVIT